MISRFVRIFLELFNRAQAFTTTPGQNGWTIADTSSSGAPTYLCVTEDGGAAKLTLANDTEVENVCLYQNDVLVYDLARIQFMKFWAKVASIGATTVVTMGLASARNDDEDAISVGAWFKIEGATSTSAIVVETDDDTNNNDDKATGKALSTTYKEFVIDFTNGLQDVRFYCDGDRVAADTTFDMSDAAAGQNVQPFFQLEKGATAGQPALTIAGVEIQYQDVLGA